MMMKTRFRYLLVITGVSLLSLSLVRCGPLSPSIAKSTQAPIPIPTPESQSIQTLRIASDSDQEPVLEISSQDLSEAELHSESLLRLAVGENDIEFGDFSDEGEFEIETLKGKKLKKVILHVSQKGLNAANEKHPSIDTKKIDKGARTRVSFEINEDLQKEVRSISLVYE